MAELRRVPPGRAGRLWLTGRLRTAQRAATLLDRKLRILRTEQERFVLLTRRTGEAAARTRRAADQWLARAAATGGQRSIRLARTDGPATVEVEWATVMGIRYPASAECHVPGPATSAPVDGSAALTGARAAYQEALTAAVSHAVASAARRVVDREAAITRQRLRAINDRWIPRLDEALRELTQLLEETERAETVQLRWAATARPGAEG
jgi:V/A-type H+-transporting ATPase subunit D